jgi:hypothetical protein
MINQYAEIANFIPLNKNNQESKTLASILANKI